MQKKTNKEPDGRLQAFKTLPRLLDMIPRIYGEAAACYADRLAAALEAEGYAADARLVRQKARYLRGEDIAMAVQDGEKEASR